MKQLAAMRMGQNRGAGRAGGGAYGGAGLGGGGLGGAGGGYDWAKMLQNQRRAAAGLGGKKRKAKGKGKKKRRGGKRASTLEYKRVDQLWDSMFAGRIDRRIVANTLQARSTTTS